MSSMLKGVFINSEALSFKRLFANFGANVEGRLCAPLPRSSALVELIPEFFLHHFDLFIPGNSSRPIARALPFGGRALCRPPP